MTPGIQRGDVFWANLDPTIGVEIQKTRPVVVMSNDVINQRSQLVIVVPLTTNVIRLSPSHVLIPRGEGGLTEDSKVLAEQIRAMDKQRLTTKDELRNLAASTERKHPRLTLYMLNGTVPEGGSPSRRREPQRGGRWRPRAFLLNGTVPEGGSPSRRRKP